MVNFYTDRDTGHSYLHSEDVTDTTFAEFLSDERSRGHDVVAGIVDVPDDDDDTPAVSGGVSAAASPDVQAQRQRMEAERQRAEALRQQQEDLRQQVQRDLAQRAKDRETAADLERKQQQAGALQGAIDNAVRRPTTAIYAQYLAGHMPESQVLAAIEEQIAARLEGMGIDTGAGPTVAGTGGVRVGTGLWPEGAPPGAVSAESGSALVKRMAQAELEQLQSRFAGFIPQQNTAGGETKPAYDTRLAAYQAATAANPSAIAPLPGAISPETFVPAIDPGIVDDRTVFKSQADLNRERRLIDEERRDREKILFPGDGIPLPGADPGAIIGPEDLGDIIRREREATQEGRNLELLDYLNRTFNFGGLSPIVQRPLSRAVGTGPDLTSQYFTQLFGQGSRTGQVPTQTFASFLQGGLPTAASLQSNLRNIFGQLGQGGDTNFLRTLQGTFQDPKDVFGAALQPGLKRVAPAVRGAFESQAGQQFQNVLAADPMRFKTPRESFRWFGNKGYF